MKIKAHSSQRGVTLTELMIIVGILGIMVTLSAGDFTQWVRRMRFKTMTRSIYNGLVLARAEAVRQGRVVKCNLGPQRFEVFVDTDGDGVFTAADNFIFSYPTVDDWFALREGYELVNFRRGMSIESDDGIYVYFNSRGYSIDNMPAQNLRELTFPNAIRVVDDELTFSSIKHIEVSAAGSVRIRH